MHAASIAIRIAIFIIYPFFFNKLANVIFKSYKPIECLASAVIELILFAFIIYWDYMDNFYKLSLSGCALIFIFLSLKLLNKFY